MQPTASLRGRAVTEIIEDLLDFVPETPELVDLINWPSIRGPRQNWRIQPFENICVASGTGVKNLRL